MIVVWCNGSTSEFDSDREGSIPSKTATLKEIPMKEGWDGKFKKLASDNLINSGRASFELSGYKTTERQWENLKKFSKLLNK